MGWKSDLGGLIGGSLVGLPGASKEGGLPDLGIDGWDLGIDGWDLGGGGDGEDWKDIIGNILTGGKFAGHQTSTTTTAPWEPQQGYIKDVFSQASGLSRKPIQYYGGDLVADFTPQQMLAQGLTSRRALSGSPLLSGAQQETYDTMAGKYLTPESNPYLSDYTKRAFEETLPQLDTTAMQAGRYGSGAWGLQKGRTMADIQSNIYGGAYENERNRQAQATAMAPEMAKEDYYDIGKLSAVGEEQQAMEQANIDAAKQKFEFEQMEPWQRLSMLSNLVTGDFGGTTESEIDKKGK